MPVLNIKEDRPGGHVITENNYAISREQIMLAQSATIYPSGAMLGKLTANGKFTHYNPAGADGSQNFAGVLWERRDATAGDQRAVAHVRSCEINGREVTYALGALTAPQLAAAEAAAAANNVLIRY